MTQEKGKPDQPLKPNNLSTKEAIDLIGKYLSKEWKYLKEEDVQVVRLQ